VAEQPLPDDVAELRERIVRKLQRMKQPDRRELIAKG
jgi:hypothetical protein